ncbi:MAG: DUF4238 domain-containing protein [Cetobacterium sp.]|uniref:DUF4238 domain-containing protein n=1 Tax=Cetobacterium sp. TaxID=2071632 RepID=UPI003F2C09A0
MKLYQIYKKITIENAPIRHQCSKDWFYGKGDTEENLSQIEYNTAKIIQKILEDKKLGLEEREQIYKFIYLQSSRTKKKIDNTNFILKNLKRAIFKILSPFNDEEINSYISETEMVPKELVEHSQIKYKEILDLDFIVLETNKNNEFVISDNPVIHYNYYEKKFNAGIMKTGEMIIMPVSPNKTIVLYDKKIYDFNNTSESQMINIESEDVKRLNNLQYIHCNQNIYFKTNLEKQKEYFKEIDINSININFIDIKFNFFCISKEGEKLIEDNIKNIKETLEALGQTLNKKHPIISPRYRK